MPMRKYRKRIVVTILVLALGALLSYSALAILFNVELYNEFKAQKSHIEMLKTSGLPPIDEGAFANFDLNDNDLHLNEIQVLATHNSYKRIPNKVINFPSYLVSQRTRNGYYGYESLTKQLDVGIRGLELDITMYGDKPVLMHWPPSDWRTNGPDFALALQEIKLWSQRNPNHTPINIMLQIRDTHSPYNHKYGKVSKQDLANIDKLFVDIFGDDGIITPADVKKDYDTMQDALEQNGWPLLKDCMGKVFFLALFDSSTNRDKYLDLDRSYMSQKAFILYKRNEVCSYTAVILGDNATIDTQQLVEFVNKNYIVRSRIDEQKSYSEERWRTTIDVGATILTTDHMVGGTYAKDYVCRLDGEKTIIARGSI